MKLLDRMFERRATKQILGNPRDPVLAAWFGADRSASGVEVDENIAMNYSAVWAATRILTGSAGMLPLKMYRHVEGGGKEEARDRPEWRLVHDSPNPAMGSMMFRSSRMKYQVNSGNGYAEIERNGAGRVMYLWPIHTSRVQPPFWSPDRELYYPVKNNDGRSVDIPGSDILHFPSILSADGIIGLGVVAHARQSIGMGMATEQHGAALFGNGARPGFVVKHPKVLSDKARENFRREWNEMYQGPENAHKMALLSEGADVVPLGFSPEDSQFLETRQHNVEEIARWYGVPPHMIQHLLRATFNNIEHMSVEFVTYSLMPWLVIWEQELNRKLLSEADQEEYFFEHCVDGLLRGDAYTRAQALQLQFQNGALNIDEWRAIENRNPLPDGAGQKHFVQLNMTTAEKAGEEPVEAAAPPEPSMNGKPAVNGESYRAIIPHRSALAHSIGRLVRKEALAARRAVNNPSGFLSWSDEFYAKHEDNFANEITPHLRAAHSVFNPKLDTGAEARRIAKEHISKAREELLEAAGVAPDRFKDAVESCVVGWEQSRADDLADHELSLLLGGNHAVPK